MMEIRYYITSGGKAPFIDWLEGLKDRTARAKIKVRIDRLMLGLFGDAKKLGNGIEELRISYGPGYRIYYGRIGRTIVLLLRGGTKKHQSEDIAKAKGYWANFLEDSDEK